MSVSVPSFAKINLGLRIGPLRSDGFHELRTVYQTIALHDFVRVSIGRGTGINIRCDDPRVPCDGSNTCYKIADRTIEALKMTGRVEIAIEKRLPVQGGSDLPLFLIGGTVLGVARGEEVYPLPDLPSTPCVVALPEIAISTPRAFRDWDARNAIASGELTCPAPSDRMLTSSREISAWLAAPEHGRRSGVSAKGGGRAESPLLDLVRTGIENDFEEVVFPQHPELREVKRVLERSGAQYASLSGSGSAVYGLFASREKADAARKKLSVHGTRALVTTTLTKRLYWRRLLAVAS
jgi:4-diphosphocytidyl-2-C-methyl-D-erythritol kinase